MKSNIVEYFSSLAPEKKEHLLNQLILLMNESEATTEDSISKIRNNRVEEKGLQCPNCNSTKIISFGSYSKGKRYRCKDCKKTFSEFTSSPLYWLHKKDLFKEYLYYFLQGYSLRNISDEMDICLKTAFDWRHKILFALGRNSKKELKGLIEVDETYFLFSEKGNKSIKRKPRKRGGVSGKDGINKDHIAIFIAYSRRDKSVTNGVGCRGRITKKAFHNTIGKHLDRENCILCTDSHLTYQGYVLEHGIKQERIYVRKRQYVKDKIYHVQNVNNYHAQLKSWMRRFNGVASKYLDHYMDYYGLIFELKNKTDEINESLKKLLYIDNGYVKSQNIKQQFCIT
ncbi:MAG: IS1595 family transposase [Bacteroidetes bacterium]|nr:IS1595 family transposase [Bacteroidota bacterium]